VHERHGRALDFPNKKTGTYTCLSMACTWTEFLRTRGSNFQIFCGLASHGTSVLMKMNLAHRYGNNDEVTPEAIKCLENLRLSIPCNTWDPDIALEFFGEHWETSKTEGRIVKVTGKKMGALKFHVNVPQLETVFKGYDWKYVMENLDDDLHISFHGILGEVAAKLKPKVAPKRKAAANEEHESSEPQKKKAKQIQLNPLKLILKQKRYYDETTTNQMWKTTVKCQKVSSNL
jgi:hypothetical protein